VSEIKITAEPRTEFGKGPARRIRRDQKVPAVLYGHGIDPVHLILPGHALMLALKNANALMSIELDGKSQLALPKQVQRDPIRGHIEHADLILVRRGEKVVVDVPLHITGEASRDALVVVEHATISVQAEATHLPEAVEVSVEGLEPGSQILGRDLLLPAGSTLQLDPEALVVNVTAAPTAEEIEAELADAEADAGIERDESDADLEAADADAGGDGESGQGGESLPDQE
jgi:large subunit ribosomal protein L25